MSLNKDNSNLNKIFSVIIPVFNAEQFLSHSINSAINQKEVGEVILIDDGSTDNSYKICEKFQKEYSCVKLLIHPKHENKGAGATRNLGLLNTKYPWIAFLDADDFFVNDRFKETTDFTSDEKIKLIIESAIHEHHFEEDGKDINIKSNSTNDTLFEKLLFSKGRNWICINSVCVHKELIDEIGLFDESLLQSQDTDYFLRVALAKPKFVINNRVVAVIRNHANRRVNNQDEYDFFRFKLFEKWLMLGLKKNWSSRINRQLLRGYLHNHPKVISIRNSKIKRISIKLILLFEILRKNSIIMKKVL